MTNNRKWHMLAMGLCVTLVFCWTGCSKEEAAETMKEAADGAEKAAGAVAKEAGELAEKGGEMASELGEKAMAYLAPLKEKMGGLEGLKESPEKLKVAVADLIKMIEEKAEDVQLPEMMSNALSTVKEKLVALGQYLEGEVEQAKIDEHIKSIKESVESGLGISK